MGLVSHTSKYSRLVTGCVVVADLYLRHTGACSNADDPCQQLPLVTDGGHPVCGSDGVSYVNSVALWCVQRSEDPCKYIIISVSSKLSLRIKLKRETLFGYESLGFKAPNERRPEELFY